MISSAKNQGSKYPPRGRREAEMGGWRQIEKFFAMNMSSEDAMIIVN